MTKKTPFYALSFFLVLLLGSCASNRSGKQNGAADRPNIVVILADDLGFSDIGSFGGEIKTPNLDYLAANGLRFSNFYNTSRCCPSRAALLTGLYNHMSGIGEMTTDRNEPGYRGHLTENTVTLAEVLKDAGYHTAMSGKWHVSNTLEQATPAAQLRWLNHQEVHPLFSPIEQYPVNRGFERYFGNIWGVVDYFDPFSLVSGTKPITDLPAGYYHTDAINDTAVSYINELSRDSKPFFLYVAETAPHWPLQALPEDISKYENTYKAGWQAIREARYKKMVAQGIVDPATTALSPRFDDKLAWENNPDSVWDARAMAVHAAMVDRMDQGIGRILDALRKTERLDNTIIIFLSDNGASPENAMRFGPGFDRPGETRTGEKIEYPLDKKVLPGPHTTFTSIGERWANVANTPYRYAKAQSYEGGIHTPMIAFWPKGIPAKGGISKQTGHVMDFMSTFVELAHAKYPTQYHGHTITPTNGISLVPAFKGKDPVSHGTLYNEHYGARYIRDGNWKMVSLSTDSTWHLYDIDRDKTEVNDLASQHPDVVSRLTTQWKLWANTHNVLPKKH